MDLFEYQARDLFAKHGVPVLAGEVIDTPEAAREVAERLGGRAVVKAQVKVGGRGKAGGVKLAADPADAVAKAGAILGMSIVIVGAVMVSRPEPVDGGVDEVVLLPEGLLEVSDQVGS